MTDESNYFSTSNLRTMRFPKLGFKFFPSNQNKNQPSTNNNDNYDFVNDSGFENWKNTGTFQMDDHIDIPGIEKRLNALDDPKKTFGLGENGGRGRMDPGMTEQAITNEVESVAIAVIRQVENSKFIEQ